jgi:hypothetical protein
MLLDLFIHMQALNVVVATTIEVVSMGLIMVPSRINAFSFWWALLSHLDG